MLCLHPKETMLKVEFRIKVGVGLTWPGLCSRSYISLRAFLGLCSGFWLSGLLLGGCILLGPFREVGTEMGIQAGYSRSRWEFAVAHLSES